jgi:hypothetical protein
MTAAASGVCMYSNSNSPTSGDVCHRYHLAMMLVHAMLTTLLQQQVA